MEGEFQRNEFHGDGHRIDYINGKASAILMGEFEHGLAHGKNTFRHKDGYL